MSMPIMEIKRDRLLELFDEALKRTATMTKQRITSLQKDKVRKVVETTKEASIGSWHSNPRCLVHQAVGFVTDAENMVILAGSLDDFIGGEFPEEIFFSYKVID